jgi:hypothetical protein
MSNHTLTADEAGNTARVADFVSAATPLAFGPAVRDFQAHPKAFIKFIKTLVYLLMVQSQAKTHRFVGLSTRLSTEFTHTIWTGNRPEKSVSLTGIRLLCYGICL